MRLIDADAITWEKVCECFDRCFDLREYNDSYKIESIMDIIKTIPTVDPVKHGHWVELEDGVIDYNTGEAYKRYKCSSCGALFEMRECDHTAYCCECGAKMDEDLGM